jgi:Holliday junction resolvasome RuvABC endonuclease subunit
MTMRRPIAAIDIGTKTGFCVGLPDVAAPLLGSISFASAVGLGPRGASFADWLGDFITVHNPETLVFEAPIPAGQQNNAQTARFLLGAAFVVEVICWRRDVRCCEVAISTMKKHFTGYGHAAKSDIVKACAVRGWDNKGSEDAADAGGVWDYAVSQFHPQLWRQRMRSLGLPTDLAV